MNAITGFWVTQLEANAAEHFKGVIQDDLFDDEPSNRCVADDDYEVLLPSVQIELVASSQMFFDEPWFTIAYDDREAETARLYEEYRQAIVPQLSDEGVDMDEYFKINRETMYDDFPDAWDSPVAYELGERVHLWISSEWTWFLGVSQEDKELPIDIHFGRFNSGDMKQLSVHMRAFSKVS